MTRLRWPLVVGLTSLLVIHSGCGGASPRRPETRPWIVTQLLVQGPSVIIVEDGLGRRDTIPNAPSGRHHIPWGYAGQAMGPSEEGLWVMDYEGELPWPVILTWEREPERRIVECHVTVLANDSVIAQAGGGPDDSATGSAGGVEFVRFGGAAGTHGEIHARSFTRK